MGDLVNLNRFRKKQARAEKARRAEANRRLHGLSKAERAAEAAQKARLEGQLDGAFLEALGASDTERLNSDTDD